MNSPTRILPHTILADGNVLMTGGFDNASNPQAFKTRPYVWKRVERDWDVSTALASEPRVRVYHSAALLLPDGRVLSASGIVDSRHIPKATIYWPRYLYVNNQGNPAVRCTITSAPDSVSYCDEFTVNVTDTSGIQVVSFVRPGAVTHGFNMDQRYVPLKFSFQSGAALRVQMTANAHLAPPGDYMLFVLKRGVPSIAKWVRLRRDTVAPATISSLVADLATQYSVFVSWTAPGDEANCGRATEYDLRYSTSPITEADFAYALRVGTSGPKNPGAVETMEVPGLSSCTNYWFAVKTRDEVGNWSAISNVEAGSTTCGGCCSGLAGGDPGVESAQARSRERGHERLGGQDVSGAGEATDGYVFTRRVGGAPFWGMRRLTPEQVRLFGSDTVGAVLVLPDSSGETGRYTGVSAASLLAISRPGRRIIALGSISLGHIEPKLTAWSILSASHSAHGNVTNLVRDSLYTPILEPGDSLDVAYAADSASSQSLGSPAHFTALSVVSSGNLQARTERSAGLPMRFALHQNQPNPFASATLLRFDLPRAVHVKLEILDIQGRRVATLANAHFEPGYHTVTWPGRSRMGNSAPGVYLYRIRAGEFRDQKKMILLP